MSAADGLLAGARSDAYRFLGAGFCPPDATLLAALRDLVLAVEEGMAVLDDEGCSAAVAAARAALDRASAEDLGEAYLACFGHAISKDCPPYECEYGQAHIHQKAQALADIAGFYRAFGLERAPGFKDRHDHVSAELEFMAFLCLKEAYALANGHDADRLALGRKAQRDFLAEHLGAWAFAFCDKLKPKTGGGFYGRLAALLEAFLGRELRHFGLALVQEAEAPVAEEPEPVAGCDGCPWSGDGPTEEGMRA